MRFLPRDERFFGYLQDQSRMIFEAAQLLHQGVQAGGAQMAQAAERITALERKSDAVLTEVFKRLNLTFLTPLDPEDIHELSSRLDNVMDAIEDAALCTVDYRVDTPPPAAVEICGHIVACTKALQLAFEALAGGQKMIEHCVEVNRIEQEVDDVVRYAIRDLFETERDPIQIIKVKELYDFLELATDHCEDVSDALQTVIVKNS